MPEIRLESFILRSSMATGFQWAGFHWSRHWGLLINGLLYELTLGEKAFIFRSFTFDGEIPDAAREVTSSTYMGWTHCTDEELRVIASEVEREHNSKGYFSERLKGYNPFLNNCQTTAITFWDRIRCLEVLHEHPPANMPTHGRQVFAGAVGIGDTVFAIWEDNIDGTVEANWPAIEDFALTTVHYVVDGAHNVPDQLWASTPDSVLYLLDGLPRPLLLLLKAYLWPVFVGFRILGAEFKALGAAASLMYSLTPVWISVPLEAISTFLYIPTWFGAAFVTIRGGYRVYKNARLLWRAGQFAVAVWASGELAGLKWRKMLGRLIGSGRPPGAIGTA